MWSASFGNPEWQNGWRPLPALQVKTYQYSLQTSQVMSLTGTVKFDRGQTEFLGNFCVLDFPSLL